MAELSEVDSYRFCTLVNRTAVPAEFMFDGKIFAFKPNGTLTVPVFVAEWLHRTGNQRVWTTEGDFVPRFGITEGPEDLIGLLGDEAFETTPVTPKPDVIEGWDTREIMRDPTKTKVLPVRLTKADYANQGNAATASMGAPPAVMKREG